MLGATAGVRPEAHDCRKVTEKRGGSIGNTPGEPVGPFCGAGCSRGLTESPKTRKNLDFGRNLHVLEVFKLMLAIVALLSSKSMVCRTMK